MDELNKAISAWEREAWLRGNEFAKTVTPEQKDLLRQYRQARWYIRYFQDVLRERTYERDKFYCEWPGKPFAYHPRTEEAVRSFLQAWKEEKARCWQAFRESMTPEQDRLYREYRRAVDTARRLRKRLARLQSGNPPKRTRPIPWPPERPEPEPTPPPPPMPRPVPRPAPPPEKPRRQWWWPFGR